MRKKIACSALTPKVGTTIYHTGPALDKGLCPAIFYFALSGEESLCQDPYNQPVQFLSDFPIRIFSISLPSHDLGLSPAEALKSWSEDIASNKKPTEEFIENARFCLSYLVKEGLIEKKQLGLMGLSRGGFIASHLAAFEPDIRYILQFAPLTKLSFAKDFKNIENIASYDVHNLASYLYDRDIKIYIGNLDQRVGTENAFMFARALAQTAFAHKIRSPQVEMVITPSLGHQGHGTSPQTFKDGALWLANYLINNKR